jgi:hypothetical protein
MRSIVGRTASAKRRTGGVGFTVEPTARAWGSAERSQFEMVFGQTEVPDLEGAETLERRVVRALLLRNLPEASGEEIDDLPAEPGVELRLVDAGLHSGEGVVEVSKLAEVGPCGEAEKAGGGQDGPQCEALGGLVDLAPELAADGPAESVGSGGGSGLGARGQVRTPWRAAQNEVGATQMGGVKIEIEEALAAILHQTNQPAQQREGR